MNNKWTMFRRFRNWLANLIMEDSVHTCHNVRYRLVSDVVISDDMYSFGEVTRAWKWWNKYARNSKLQVRHGLVCTDAINNDGELIDHDDGNEWRYWEVNNGPYIPRN